MPLQLQHASSITRVSALAVLAIGVMVLTGWLGHWPHLTSLLPGAVPMRADTAIAFICAALALLLHGRAQATGRTSILPPMLAWIVALAGGLTIVGYAFGLGLHEPEIHVTGDFWRDLAVYRMAPATALALVLIGSALILIRSRSRVQTALYQGALLSALAISLIVIIGYLHGTSDFYQLAGYSSVAPLTATGIFLLAVGALYARPSGGVMGEMTDTHLGGRIARTVWLPTLSCVLIFGGVMKQTLGRFHLGDTTVDLLIAIGDLAIVSFAIWLSTRTLNVAHRRILHRDRLYATLSATNESIVRLETSDTLCARICGIAVEKGRFRSAWIGLLGSHAPSTSLATAGAAGRPLSPWAHDLAGQSVRNGQVVLAQEPARRGADGEHDDAGVSAGAFPLKRAGGICGVLVVESSDAVFFKSEEVDLLSEIAAGVSFALDKLEQEARRLAIELEMRESQERLQLATTAANIGFWDWDIVNDRVYVSAEWKSQLGLPAEEQISNRQEMQARLHPDDREAATARMAAFWDQGATGNYTAEFRLRHADGSYRWIHSRARAFHADNGQPRRMVGWHMDITARKNAEEAVREREARLHTVVEHLTEGLIIADLTGKILTWNRAALTMHGYDRSEGLLRDLPDFRTIYELATPEGLIVPYEEWPLSRIFRGETLRDLELRIRRLDTDWERIFSYGGTLVRDGAAESLAFLTIIDVTERNTAETAVRESEARFRELAEHVDEVFWITDPINKVALYVSPAHEKIWGTPCDQIYHDLRTWLEAVHRDDRDRVRLAAETKQESGDYDEVFRVVRPDGSLRWVRDRAFPVRNAAGQVYRIVGTARDITAQTRAELRQELQYAVTTIFAEARSLNESTEQVVRLICRTMEWTVGELWLVERPSATLRCVDVWSLGNKPLDGFATKGRSLTFRMGAGLPGKVWEENKSIWIENLAELPEFVRKPEAAAAGLHSAFGFPVHLRDEVVGVLVFYAPLIRKPEEELDTLTANLGSQMGQFIKRVRIEEQFRQAQKMEAIGQLAGGVAHDFNNLLTVIKAYPQLIAMTPDLPKAARDWLGEISAAADRAAGLTRQLLAFSRRQVLQMHPLDLNQAVNGLSNMLRRIIGEDVALKFELAPHLPLVEADTGMIEQVLLNLVVNARDAMPGGGQIVIRTRPVRIESMFLRDRPRARAGDFIALSVTDNGCGMSPEVVAHIFEPFFTTKDPGKGTGLGLATVYGIAEQHRGWIEAESREKQGSTFTLFLPPAAAAVPRAKEPGLVQTLPRGRETILLVEDEPAVRMLSKVILERLGYRVLDATSGVVALQLWAEHKDTIDLLITDMVMPHGLTGRDVAEKLRAQKPSLRVIFSTGYSPAKVAQGLNLIENANFIQKPYGPQVLSETVRTCLKNPPEPLT